MPYTIIFSPEAEEQLVNLHHYVSEAASHEVATEFTNAIISYCETIREFPHRGTKRDDIRPGLRITHFKKTTIIAFAVFDERVVILGVYYGGQNYEYRLLEAD